MIETTARKRDDMMADAIAEAREDKRSGIARDEGRIHVDDVMLVRDSREFRLVRENPTPVTFVPLNRTDAERVVLSPSFDWSADPLSDRNWCSQLHSWRMLDAYFWLIYRGEGNPARLIEAVLSVARDWYDFHIVRSRLGTFSWMDGTVGPRAMKVALLVDLLDRGFLDEDSRPFVEGLWEAHVDWLCRPENLKDNNHGLIDIHGLRSLETVRPYHPGSALAREVSRRLLHDIVLSQYDEAGVHREHSPEYHFFALRYLELMDRSGWYADDADTLDIIHRAMETAPWFRMPDQRYLAIGDSTAAPMPLSQREWAAPAENHITFNQSGYFIHRSHWDVAPQRASVLAVMGAFNSRVHKHGDDLSVLWSEQGTDILVDHGKYAYKEDPFTDYFRSSLSHNTVSIDNAPHLIRAGRIYGSALGETQDAPWGIEVEGTVVHKQPGGKHRRIVYFAPGRALVVVDQLSSNQERQYASWFHFPALAGIVPSGDGYELTIGRHSFQIRAASTKGLSSKLVKGQTDPEIQGWVSEAYADKKPAWALGLLSPAARKWTLVTVFACPGTAIDRLEVSEKEYEVEVGPIVVRRRLRRGWRLKSRYSGLVKRAKLRFAFRKLKRAGYIILRRTNRILYLVRRRILRIFYLTGRFFLRALRKVWRLLRRAIYVLSPGTGIVVGLRKRFGRGADGEKGREEP